MDEHIEDYRPVRYDDDTSGMLAVLGLALVMLVVMAVGNGVLGSML